MNMWGGKEHAGSFVLKRWGANPPGCWCLFFSSGRPPDTHKHTHRCCGPLALQPTMSGLSIYEYEKSMNASFGGQKNEANKEHLGANSDVGERNKKKRGKEDYPGGGRSQTFLGFTGGGFFWEVDVLKAC